MILKRKLTLLLAPILTFIVISSTFFYYGLYPFGDKSLAWCDMTQQSLPFMMQAGDLLQDGLRLTYSQKTAGGMNFWGVLLFFVFSPFTLLSPLIHKSDFLLWANILVLLKAMTASFTASFWFDKIFEEKNRLLTACFSVSYALCGYTMMYYQNNVWMDILYLFPLFALALVQLLKTQKFLWYAASLSILIAVNYYISYAVILFTIFAVGVCLFFVEDKNTRRQISTALALGTSIALGLTTVIWLPSFFQYLVSARTADQSIGGNYFFTDIYSTVSILFCTALALLGVVLARLNKKGDKKVLVGIILFIIMSIPLFIDPINKVWHTGSYQAFPVRYGFIPVLIGLSLAAIGIKQMLGADKAKTTPLMLLIPAVLIGIAYLVTSTLITTRFPEMTSYVRTLWVDQTSYYYLLLAMAVFLCCYIAILLALRYKKISYSIFAVTMAALVMMEGVFSSAVYMGGVARSSAYFGWITSLGDKIDDEEFYRVKTERKLFDVNLLGAIGYNNIAHYTSLTRQDYMFSMKKLGYSSYWMEVGSHGGSLITDAILNNRYLISRSKTFPGSSKMVYSNGGYWIHRLDHQLPFGVVLYGNPDDYSTMGGNQRMEEGQAFLSQLLGEEAKVLKNYTDVSLNNVDYEIVGNNHTFTIKDPNQPATISYSLAVGKEKALYFDCFHSFSNNLRELIYDSISVELNGNMLTQSYPSQSSNGVLLLGIFKDQRVNLTLTLKKSITAHSFGVWGVDTEELSAVMDTMNNSSTTDLNTHDNKVSGTAYSGSDDANLFLPIPFDEGFKGKVNNKPVTISKAFDGFMTIPLERGENEIYLSFTPRGFKAGLLVSMISLILALAILRAKQDKLLEFLAPIKNQIYYLFCTIAVLASVVVYIAPIILYFVGM